MKKLQYLIVNTAILLINCSGSTRIDRYYDSPFFLGDNQHYAIVERYEEWKEGSFLFGGDHLRNDSSFLWIFDCLDESQKRKVHSCEGWIQSSFPVFKDTAITIVPQNKHSLITIKYDGQTINNKFYSGSEYLDGWYKQYRLIVYSSRDQISGDFWSKTYENRIHIFDLVVSSDYKILSGHSSNSHENRMIFNDNNGKSKLFINDSILQLPFSADCMYWINDEEFLLNANNIYSSFAITYNYKTNKIDTIFRFLRDYKSYTVNSDKSFLVMILENQIDLDNFITIDLRK